MGLLQTTPEWKEALAAWQGIPDRPPAAYRKRSKGFQVLQNDFMEKWFGTSHWATPGLWFIPVISVCLWDGLHRPEVTALHAVGGFVAGLLTWTFTEYWLHRWLFHLPPARNLFLREIQYVMHGYHHDFPDDPGRLVAPPALSWPLALVVGTLHWLLFGPYWTVVFAGTVTGYLAYDWMHYYTHHAVPKSSIGKFMRRFHYEHHFGHAHSQFGLSSPLWDVVFRSFSTTKALKRDKKPGRSGGSAG
ncbi:MAG: sterol desaturase family protein [Alphaproteobacteria bacterium]|nr:sterol desaturase family protein [Alphaproteobacteria bacterium]